MKNEVEMVKEFHTAFGGHIEPSPNVNIPESVKMLRTKLLTEEFQELQDAQANNDLTEIVDAIGDILYVVIGTAISYGVADKLPEIFAEIHKSNMTKLWPDGKPHHSEIGKMLKGPNFKPPDFKGIIDVAIER